MKTIYVAGPYRSPTIHGIIENIRRAEEVSIEALRKGWSPFVPHKNLSLLDGLFPDAAFLAADMAWLERADAVVLAPGWENSEGTRAEIERAKEMGIPVFEAAFLPEADEGDGAEAGP